MSHFEQLQMARGQFIRGLGSLDGLNTAKEGQEMVMPLVGGIVYVPAKLARLESVTIDIGTGYYVEKSIDEAKDYFERKVGFVEEQLGKIRETLQAKQTELETLTQLIRIKHASGAGQVQA